MKKIIYLFILSLTLFSCATRDEVVYFQESEDIQGMKNMLDYEPVIEKNDLLSITVSSRSEEVVKPFQMNFGDRQNSGSNGRDSNLSGYLVSPEGDIQFPVLGPIHVVGKTRTQLEQDIQKRIRTMVTDAIVNIRIMNFKVTVLGEVNSPGRVTISDGRITLPELIATVGDITTTGERESILVVREVDGVKSSGRVDITSSEVFKNPYYYLKQNDIVYVEPTYKKIKSSGFITSYTGIFSLIGSITGLIFLFTR